MHESDGFATLALGNLNKMVGKNPNKNQGKAFKLIQTIRSGIQVSLVSRKTQIPTKQLQLRTSKHKIFFVMVIHFGEVKLSSGTTLNHWAYNPPPKRRIVRLDIYY